MQKIFSGLCFLSALLCFVHSIFTEPEVLLFLHLTDSSSLATRGMHIGRSVIDSQAVHQSR